ncbi:MAG: dihydrolipoyl dehydrogenase [Bradyrhizobium sp.]|uniref:dihydrolipoyl dehydrogenase n=1 Tax=Bradyrhizobium sp. TaxID=376 RepID=UPI003D0F2FF0
MKDRYDVIVIGAGPAGYVAAIRAAQLGKSVACVDDWTDPAGESALGGTCLNAGCIPSKVLLEASEVYDKARHEFADYGVRVDGVGLDLEAMMARKDRVVSELTRGIASLFEANGIQRIEGRGKLLSGRRVEVTSLRLNVAVELEAEYVILAAGSKPAPLAVAPLHEDLVVDSTGALAFASVPKRLGVIGAGVIGLELGAVWRRLGSEVILLEAQPEFLSMCDRQIAQEALRQYRKQGLDIRLGARVTACAVEGGRVDIDYQDARGDHDEVVDRLIVAVGRQPGSDGLCAPDTGILLDNGGFIHVDEQCRTNLPGVYAIGDLVRGPMLAHKGSEEGIMVAELIAGHTAQVNYATIPSVIYTRPEIAWAGLTEQALKAADRPYRAGVFPFAANGRARALGETGGMVKVLADAETDRLLGVHMIGPHCSELLASAVIALEFGASSEDLAATMFAHPTLSETLHEAALDVGGRAIHRASAQKVRREA